MSGSEIATIFLIRHAATDWNDQEKWQCLDDRLLSPQGEAQAEAIGERMAQLHSLNPFCALYSSPLARARQTASCVSAATGMEASVEPLLREFDCGHLSGMSFEEARSAHGSFLSKLKEDWLDQRYPGGETQREYRDSAVNPALKKLWNLFRGGRVIAVTHKGFIRSAAMQAMRLPENRPPSGLAIDNCSYFVIEIDGFDEEGKPDGRVAQMNISNHLRTRLGAGLRGA